ncbi:hypothetical protein DLJ47_10600 [Micromonospora sp. S4605]|nr:hypothetical protein DLJ47_10600 [Micromonospora sp. S4605]
MMTSRPAAPARDTAELAGRYPDEHDRQGDRGHLIRQLTAASVPTAARTAEAGAPRGGVTRRPRQDGRRHGSAGCASVSQLVGNTAHIWGAL